MRVKDAVAFADAIVRLRACWTGVSKLSSLNFKVIGDSLSAKVLSGVMWSSRRVSSFSMVSISRILFRSLSPLSGRVLTTVLLFHDHDQRGLYRLRATSLGVDQVEYVTSGGARAGCVL